MNHSARLRNPRAIFLDIGGPIYDDENFITAVRAALDELRSEAGSAPVPAGEVQCVYDDMRARQSGSIRRRLAERFLGDECRAGELSTRVKAHWTHPAGTLMPDVIPFLREVRGRSTIGVVANQEADVVDSLTRDGVAPFIDVWGVSALVGVEKPSPELFAWALHKAGVEPSDAVHVGNRLDTDVRPAKAMGIGTVWLLRGEAPDDPTREQLAEPDLAVPALDGLARIFYS